MNDPSKERSEAFLKAAYDLNDDAAMQRFYAEWAAEYDEQLEQGLGYLAPAKVCACFMRHFSDRDAPILDIGCGTGLTSIALSKSGYSTIDGLDFSAAMLEQAENRGFYRALIQADLNAPLEIADSSYAAALSSGTFTHGHVGAEPLDEIFRIIVPGGIFACTIHNDVWQDLGFDKKIRELSESGKIEVVEQNLDLYFADGARDGQYCVLRKN